MIIDTDQSYLLGLLIGGGIIRGDSLQIILPYKRWGEVKSNPERAGDIAEDILSRLNPIWENKYGTNLSYKARTDWKICSKDSTGSLRTHLLELGLPDQGELRYMARLNKIYPLLKSNEHKKNFIAGLVDTIGSFAVSHRRFVSDFQVISFEFKGNNFGLVEDVARILIDLSCFPDQILWNHPNQHSGTCRYYKSWKKGFKIRVSLDDYMLNGSFVFKSKKLSAIENKSLQTGGINTSIGKTIKISGRVTLHSDENVDWLPASVRGGHFIHNLHFNKVLGLPAPKNFEIDEYLSNFHKYFCPFTCLTKKSIKEILNIIASEQYLKDTCYTASELNLGTLLEMHQKGIYQFIFGKTKNDGFPIALMLQGAAYIIGASIGEGIKGTRIRNNYIDLIRKHLDFPIILDTPDKGTCILIRNDKFGALIGYVNDDFNKKLIKKVDGFKVYIREPRLEECIEL